MNIEFEAKFLAIDKNSLRQKLASVGAVLVKPEFLMRRVTFNPPLPIKGGWLRVRDEGDKIFMALKIVDGKSINDQREIELAVNDFDKACKLLERIGAQRKAYQETKRESWQLGKAEITIDTWPGLKPFVEVECPSEAEVKTVAATLGFNWSQAFFGAVDVVYSHELGISADVINNQTPELTFTNYPKFHGGN